MSDSTTAAGLLIQGGQVFDPDSRTFSPQDVSVKAGVIAAIGPALPAVPGIRAIDATGKIVTPGLIDSHIHAFPFTIPNGIDADTVSSRSGVTTFVDAGSTGSLNFPGFRHYVVDRLRSNMFATLNVSAIGQATLGIEGLTVGEYDDPRFMHLPSAIELVEKNRDVIVGIKVRMYTGLVSALPMAMGRELADAVKLPLVVHLAPPPVPFGEILPYLRAGDSITHVYHGAPGTMLDANGRVRPEYLEARARGVLIDTGTSKFHTCFAVVRGAYAQGFFPDIISTDLTPSTAASMVIDLPTCVNKFSALGMKLEDALAAVTTGPARILPQGQGYGRLQMGMPADLAVFEVEKGEFIYDDFFGDSVKASQRLKHVVTIKDGEVLTPQPSPRMEYDYLRR
jgi:dihydroorotase